MNSNNLTGYEPVQIMFLNIMSIIVIGFTMYLTAKTGQEIKKTKGEGPSGIFFALVSGLLVSGIFGYIAFILNTLSIEMPKYSLYSFLMAAYICYITGLFSRTREKSES